MKTTRIKTTGEQAAMREGGRILGEILTELARAAKPGVTTKELDLRARDLIKHHKTQPSFLGYRGFPGVICTAVNEEVVHTIPSDRILKDGDLLKIDGGVYHRGFHTDSAIAIAIGTATPLVKKLIKTAEIALQTAIDTIHPGISIRTVSSVIQEVIERNGFHVIRELTGHGVGDNLHEDPIIPNFGADAPARTLVPGMTIAIEPIFCAGKPGIKTLADDWNIITKDRSLAVQVEHTLLITETGVEVITRRKELDPVYATW